MQRLERLREEAWAALDEDPERAVELAREALELGPDADGHYLFGVALLEAGDPDEGEEALQQAVAADATHVDAWSALARAQFDRCAWEECRATLSTTLRLDPHHPEALYARACLRERRGDHDGAARDYAAAAAEAPEDYPAPILLSDDTVAEVITEVVAELHPSLQRYLGDVPILVDEVPDEDTLSSFDPPMGPADLLACFSGPSLNERSGLAPWTTLPATITLYRRNLARIARDHEELVKELRITLLHEIGHFLGLDEEDLAERGLD